MRILGVSLGMAYGSIRGLSAFRADKVLHVLGIGPQRASSQKAATRQKISQGKCHGRNLAGVPPGHYIQR